MQKKLEEVSAGYYARAILDIGKAEKAVDLLETEFKTLKEAVISDLDLKKYLTDPSVEETHKINMALKVLGENASVSIRTVFVMLIMVDIVEDIEEIYNIFVGFVSDFKKQIYVEVVSVIELDDMTISKIKEDVDRASGLDVRIRNTVDPDIIGGLVLKIGEKIIDLSLKNKIEDIRAKLKSIELGGEEFGAEN
ncbi:MAG: ATP synthase F1 subunit delta [Actinobacteria bacterium]|nr:ATP synthase F1 subunit delta [Actinomycetota bacterium]